MSIIIKNPEGWQLSSIQTTDRIFFQLEDKWGVQAKDPISFIFSKTETGESLSFHVDRKNGQIYITFAPYGLLGGGKNEGVVATAAFTSVGIATLFIEISPFVPAFLLSAGITGLFYSFKATDYSFEDRECIIHMLVGGGSGLISEAIQALPSSSTVSRIFSQATTQFVDIMGENYLYDERPTTKKMAITAASSLLGASSSEILSHCIHTTGLNPVVSEGVNGAGSAALSQAINNFFENKRINDGVDIAAALGGTSGVVNGITHLRSERMDFLRNKQFNELTRKKPSSFSNHKMVIRRQLRPTALQNIINRIGPDFLKFLSKKLHH